MQDPSQESIGPDIDLGRGAGGDESPSGDEATGPAIDWMRPPGRVAAIFALICAALMCLGYSEPFGGGVALILFAALGWVGVLLYWLARLIGFVGTVVSSRGNPYSGVRSWNGWFAIPLILATVVALLATNTPVRVRFGVSRGAFERAVKSGVGSAPARTVGRLGLYSDEASFREAGVTYFRTGYGFLDSFGFAWSPDCHPPNYDGMYDYRELSGGWYTYVHD